MIVLRRSKYLNFTKRALILILSLVVFVLNPIVSAEKKLVFDDAMLFTEDEIVKLEEEANNLSNDYNMDIVIVTTANTDEEAKEFLTLMGMPFKK